jgi:hypothetical protein
MVLLICSNYFKFLLAYYLLSGGLLVSTDLNKRSKQFTPALYGGGERCAQGFGGEA